jgi:hypothetical protein
MGEEDGGKEERRTIDAKNHPFVSFTSDVVGRRRFIVILQP